MSDLITCEHHDHNLIEYIDQTQVKLSIGLEKQTKQKYKQEWSMKLITQRAKVQVLKYLISMYRTGISHHGRIDYLSSNFGSFNIPTTLKNTCKEL